MHWDLVVKTISNWDDVINMIGTFYSCSAGREIIWIDDVLVVLIIDSSQLGYVRFVLLPFCCCLSPLGGSAFGVSVEYVSSILLSADRAFDISGK